MRPKGPLSIGDPRPKGSLMKVHHLIGPFFFFLEGVAPQSTSHVAQLSNTKSFLDWRAYTRLLQVTTNVGGENLHEEVLGTRVPEGAHPFNHLEDEEMLDKLTTPRRWACQRKPRRGPSPPICPLEQAVEPSGPDPRSSMIFPDVSEPGPPRATTRSFWGFRPST